MASWHELLAAGVRVVATFQPTADQLAPELFPYVGWRGEFTAQRLTDEIPRRWELRAQPTPASQLVVTHDMLVDVELVP